MGCNEELFQFDYVIKKASNAFEDYRYYFEDPKRCKPYNGQFIYHAVRWVIVEERPQWQADVDVLDAQPTSPAR
jgi:hypothetical protein